MQNYHPKEDFFPAFSGRDIATGKSVDDMLYECTEKSNPGNRRKRVVCLIGRNADFILKDREDVLNVFIHGDMP